MFCLLSWLGACISDVDHSNTVYSCVESELCPAGATCIAGSCVFDTEPADAAGGELDAAPVTTDAAMSAADAMPTASISEVSAFEIGTTDVKITWTVSESATGQTEYGPTTAYGQLSTKEASFEYATHVQQITGLSPATLYHYRVHSETMSGEVLVSADVTFTTL